MKKAYSGIILFVLVSFVLLSGEKLNSFEVPKEPILCTETGMHTAPIYRIATDSQNQFLVTGSIDKTVRVWELSTGRPLTILRPPIEKGLAGRILAVAITPDGKTIACGGRTGFAWEKSQSIYLFDRESGKLVRRIKDLPDVSIYHLVYSKDGRFLVATLGEGKGIRVYRTEDYSIAGEDKDYGGHSHSADFDEGGRLVTASHDGLIRLYGNDFKLIIKKKAPGGSKPFGVSFSPDGSNIAVGFGDSSKVDVLSGKDLSRQYSPDTSGVTKGGFISVCWSTDGKFLYAGKTWSPVFIRRWARGGKRGWGWGPGYKDLPTGEYDINDVLPLKEGGVVFCTSNPSFGAFGPKGQQTLNKGPSIAEYRGSYKEFLISQDGSTLQFGYEILGKSPARFSISERSLKVDPPKEKIFSGPTTTAPGLEVTGWEYSDHPKLNGKSLNISGQEFSYCVAIFPDKNTFIIGTSLFIRLYDKLGNKNWENFTQSAVYSLNISKNGRVAAAALGDGTLRWYRMKDGKELLALFPHRDKKRWVLWTPSGYYDASPGAEELMGWHVNNGREEAADFFPISRFRSTYYRPDVIAKTLETLDEGEAIKLANKESGKKVEEVSVAKIFPPVVSILSPRDGAEVSNKEIEVKFSIRNPSPEPLTTVKVLVDGRPIGRGLTIKEIQKDQDVQATKVPIPEKDAEISIIAENRNATSEPATVSLKWSGKVKEGEFTIKPKLYVLAIGVSKYEDKHLTLQFAAKDAKDFAESLLKEKGGLYRDVVVKVLTDEKATRDEIIDGFDWISKETTSKDIAIIFLAGHGVNEKGGVYYFLPVNANVDRLRRTAVPFSEMKNTVTSLAGKTILFIDTCHAGNVMGARGVPADIMGIVNELASAENGAVVFASSTGKQYSFEDSNWGNGAFTKAVVEGIYGKADYTGKGKITINMLDLYISERVKELTKGKQTPATAKPQTIPDFPLVLKR
ncbi:MAG TPA: caspase family protein [Thermodesulfobacteriota bacterium]|nr:caspase family protein [Thermodesulfobacteriota bacterium]